MWYVVCVCMCSVAQGDCERREYMCSVCIYMSVCVVDMCTCVRHVQCVCTPQLWEAPPASPKSSPAGRGLAYLRHKRRELSPPSVPRCQEERDQLQTELEQKQQEAERRNAMYEEELGGQRDLVRAMKRRVLELIQ